MAFSDDAMARKIEGLRRKAEDGATTEAERETLQSKIAELTEKYMLDAAMLDAAAKAAGGRNIGEQIVRKSMEFKGVYAKAYVQAAFSQLSALGNLKGVYRQKKQSLIEFDIVGFETDVEQAILLLTSLQLQAATEVGRWANRQPYWDRYTPSEKYNERRGFIVGFGNGSATRIKRARQLVVDEQETKTPGTELMLVDRGKLVDQRYAELYPSLRAGRSMKMGSNGYGAGRVAGQQANTGDTQVGERGQREIR